MTNIQDLSAWLTVVQGGGIIVLVAVLYYLRTAFIPRAEHKKFADDVGARLTSQSERIGVADVRLTRAEDKILAMPTQIEMNKLTVAMSDLRGDVRVLTKQLETMQQQFMRGDNR